jgi:16S rRNA U516 pseudouridylate synthase RsuA-like enzyme
MLLVTVKDGLARQLRNVAAVHGKRQVVHIARPHIHALDLRARVKQHVALALARQFDLIALFRHLQEVGGPQRGQKRLRRLQ